MAGGFVANTRRKIIVLPDQIRPAGGGTSSINFPKTGMLAAIHLAIRGTVGGTVTTANALGMASIINRLRVTLNSGIDVINISGAGAHYLLREVIGPEYIDPWGQSNARSAVTAAAFNLDLSIPIAINDRDPVGLIMLQNEQTLLTLSIDWASDASVVLTGGGTVTAATCSPYVEVFTVPVDPQDYPPLNILHQILEDQQQVSGAGDYTYNWPRGNTYLQILHGMGIAAAGVDNFSKFAVRVNQSDYLQQTDIKYLDLEFRRLRGRVRPAGGIFVDLLATSGLGNFGLTRDVFNSALVTDLASVITASAAGTLFTVRRQLVVLQ
jgi:hypothetical protein